MKNIQVLKYSLLMITGIIILVNILSNRFFVRLDATEDNRYTLSQATRNVLRELEEPVTIKAYFTKEVPPGLLQAKKEFNDLLVEYARRSGGMVLYEFIDPSESPELEQEAQQAGIPPMQVQVRNNDKFEAMVVYLGATIQMGESNPEVIPQILEGMPMEYHLTSAIKKVSVMDKPRIAFLQGHGEPSLAALNQVRTQLNVLYETTVVNLTDTTDALAGFNTLVIVAPTDSFPESHLQQLDRFLAQGKNIFIAMNRVDADLQNGYGMGLTTGLEGWLGGKGIYVENSFLVDANCGRVSVVQNMGGFQVQQQIPFPFLPIIKNFNADHPISKGIEEAIFSFASPLSFTEDSLISYTPLAFSSDKSGTQSAPTYFNPSRKWSESDFPREKLPIAVAVEGPIEGSIPSKMVVFADGDFAVNQEGQGGQQINPDNVSLFTNSVDWLTDVSGLIELRTKETTSRPIDDLEDARKGFLKWFNFLLPIILTLLIGVYRWQMQSVRRIKRMQENYVS